MQRELVERAIGGDHDAFSSLVDASVDRLYAVATLILRDSDRAQDAVQDALVSAWKDVRALRDPDAWDAWLHRMTVWACYRVAKKDRRRSLVELHVVPDSEPSASFDAAAALRDRDLVERELNDLPLDHRAVIVLRFYLDLPVAAGGGDPRYPHRDRQIPAQPCHRCAARVDGHRVSDPAGDSVREGTA